MATGAGNGSRIFVSSTFIDNVERRKIVEDAILRAGMVPVGMERFTASSRPTVQECEEQVRGCDWLIGILAYRYGWVPPEQPEGQEQSITEIEYDTAKAAGMPRLMFVIDGSIKVDPHADFDQGADRWKKQEKLDAFKAKINADQMPAVFQEEKLGAQVLQAIFEERTRQMSQRAGRQQGAASSTAKSDDDDDDAGPVSREELQRYLKRAEALHQDMALIGLKTKRRMSVQLHELYVPLRAVFDRHGRGRDVFTFEEVEQWCSEPDAQMRQEEVKLIDAFRRAKARRRRGLVLLGEPGSGKTTHLEQVLLRVVRDGPESMGLPPGTVPLFLPLRNLADPPAELDVFIQQELGGPGVKPDFGQRLCERGRLLLLLDGLDEVASAEQRARVSRWIETLLPQLPESHILVSCRYAGYSGAAELHAKFLELHLRPFDDGQMRTFVTNWYATIEDELCTDAEQASINAEKGAKELLEILEGTEFSTSSKLYTMTRNPLLLTTLCLVHHDLGRLPHARAKLYEESIAVLLERWRHRSAEALPLLADDAEEVLRPVARWLHEGRRKRGNKAELTGPVEQGLAKLRHVKLGAEGFLRRIRDESGLLTGWSTDEYGFMHLGFQEFLTAQQLRNEGLKNPKVFEDLAARFGDSWWQEVILLMLAQRNPPVFEEFMRHVVRRPEFEDWANSATMALVFDEAAAVSAEPFLELLRLGDHEVAAEPRVAAVGVLRRRMPEALDGAEELVQTLMAKVATGVLAMRQPGQAHPTREAPRGGVELVLIPGGTFMMGSPESEPGRDVYGKEFLKSLGHHPESPQHEVTLESFYLAKTPVTNAQYAEYLKANPEAPKPKHWGDRQYNQPEQPVVGVSWKDAQKYCEWAGLTLPTEAQWEYVCRAGTTTRYHSGHTPEDLERVGWYRGNSGMRLHAVGELEPNAFGLYDMHGNVFEWCEDDWGSYEEAEHRSGDGLRTKPEGVANRVLRGGGWISDAVYARSAFRFWVRPGERSGYVGFRPAQVIPSSVTPSPLP